MSTVCAR